MADTIWTVSVFCVIVWLRQLQFGALTGSSTGSKQSSQINWLLSGKGEMSDVSSVYFDRWYFDYSASVISVKQVSFVCNG